MLPVRPSVYLVEEAQVHAVLRRCIPGRPASLLVLVVDGGECGAREGDDQVGGTLHHDAHLRQQQVAAGFPGQVLLKWFAPLLHQLAQQWIVGGEQAMRPGGGGPWDGTLGED